MVLNVFKDGPANATSFIIACPRSVVIYSLGMVTKIWVLVMFIPLLAGWSLSGLFQCFGANGLFLVSARWQLFIN